MGRFAGVLILAALVLLGMMTFAFGFTNEMYTKYAEFGLLFDNDKGAFYYQDEPVRYFEDFYTNEQGHRYGSNYTNMEGVIDVYAQYDDDGNITGIVEFSAPYFDASPRARWVVGGDYAANESMDSTETASIYKPYEAYGLTYDASTRLLYYHGELVHFFQDDAMVIISENPVIKSGTMNSYYPTEENDGAIDVYAIRSEDKSQLMGLSIADQDTFDAMTRTLEDMKRPIPIGRK